MLRGTAYALAILGVSVATAAAWTATLDFDLPAPTGAHSVGRIEGAFVDDGGRDIAYTLYHPAVPGTGAVGPYMPEAIAAAVAARDLGAFAAMPDPWGRVRHHVADGADWAEGRFPLIVFSPGADVQPQYYSSLLAELASHGHAVAALSHPDLTPFIAYPDGRVASSPEPVMPRSIEDAVREHEARIRQVAADIGAAVAQLRVTHSDRLDGRVAAFGHSLGGAGAVAAAVADEGILAVGDIDGSLGETARHVALDRPVFFMTDGGPTAPADGASRAAFVQGGEPGLKVTLHGASHMTFATDVNHFEEAIPFMDGDSLGAAEAHRDVARPLVDFFAQALQV